MESAANKQQKKHFVLVHGACHGAWTWYKLKPLLESAGHTVTALDLAASGIDTKKIHELRTFYDYTLPLLELMASLPQGEKVILVGHSLGGMNLALAMDRYPEKVSVGVFLTALLPDTVHRPSYVLQEFDRRTESWLDSKHQSHGAPEEPLVSIVFGPRILASKIYQLCPIEDLTLATTLVRPASFFLDDLGKSDNFSTQGFASVKWVYVVCDADEIITEEFQRWMIDNSGAKEVKEIMGADHMPMFSKPRELFNCLLEIANEHA